MEKSPGTQKLEAVFADLPPEQRRLAEALRRAIRAEGPKLTEDVKWNAPVWIGQKMVFCLMLYDDHINLGFWRGAALAPTHPTIEGTGKSLRHIKVHGPADARLASVQAAIRAAIRLDAAE